MAFENATFPDFPMKHELSRETIYPINVRSNGTLEWRGTHVRYEKFRWSLATQTMTPTQKKAIRDFLVARNHGLQSFKFNDPTYSMDDVTLVHVSGSNWKMDLAGGLHPLYNADPSLMTVTVNGSPGTLGSVSIVNDEPVVSVTGTSGGETVLLSGPVTFTVKLVTPMSYAVASLDCTDAVSLYNVQPITLQEVHGEY